MPTMTQDMVIIHRVFRREFAILPRIVRAVDEGDTVRAERVATHAQLLLDVLEHHHAGEDLLLWPRLRERAPGSGDLIERMDADHRSLHEGLAAMRHHLADWRSGAHASARERLAASIADLQAPLAHHLDAEEAQVLPLVDVHLTHEEWGELGKRGLGALSPDDAMIVLGQMNEDSPPDEWAGFVAHLPPPVQEAFRLQGLPSYPAYVAAVRGL